MTEQQREVLKRAIKMLREEALGIQQGHTLSGNWDGEEEAKSAHDEMLAVASQLDALSHAEGEAVELDRYDAGVLGGTDDSPTCWWHDYIRSELDSAHDFYQQQVDGLTRPEPQRRAYTCDHQPDKETADRLGGAGAAFAAGCGGDDYEELGHYLLRTLAEEGFGVFELNTHPAPQVAEEHIPVPRALVEHWANVDAFQAPKGAAMELKTIAQQMLVNFDAKAPKTAPRVAVPEGYALVPVDPNEEMLDAWFTAPQGDSGSVQGFATAYRAMLAAAPTAPAGELVTRCTAGLGCDEKGYCDAAATGQGDLCDRRTMAHERPVSDPDGLPEPGRREAEQAYINGAFDYARDPIGSRDWVLFWNGWQARDKSAPAPDEREVAALALERHADNLIVMAERDGRNSDRESQQTWEEAAYFAKQEAARLRAGKEGQ